MDAAKGEMKRSPIDGLRLLVVEDEGSIRMHVEAVLEDAGCLVVAAAGRLAEAMEAARSHEFDCALLDVNLDGEFSYPVATLLMQRGVPFIFLTAYASPIVGFDGVPTVEKPFVESVLLATLARVATSKKGSAA